MNFHWIDKHFHHPYRTSNHPFCSCKFDTISPPFRWHCRRQCQRNGGGYSSFQFNPPYGFLKKSIL